MRVIPVACPAVCDLVQSYMTYSDALFVVGVVVVVVEKKPVWVCLCAKERGHFRAYHRDLGPVPFPVASQIMWCQ